MPTCGLNNQAPEKAKKQDLRIRDCGLADYRRILELQHRLCSKRRENQIPDTILIVEHHAVITLGVREPLNKLRAGRGELDRRGMEIVEIRRGGGATAHNPGQLVCYPILHLGQLGLGISEYIRTLETVGAELLSAMGVDSTRRKGSPGLWVGQRKIASVGVRVSKSVTYHGIAINIRNDLSIFDLIVPCGLDGVQMTSAKKETGADYSMSRARATLASLLANHVGRERQ